MIRLGAAGLTSAIAFVLAGMLATTAHEISHFSMALALGEQPTLFPTFVNLHDNVSQSHLLLIASTGPVFSLVSGLLIIFLTRGWSLRASRLFLLWFGFLSAQIGFGYLLASVITSSGDTGLALSLLHAPFFAFAFVAVVGALGSWVLLPRLYAVRVSPLVADKGEFNQIGMYAWLVGTAVLLAVYLVIELVMKGGNFDLFGLFAIVTIGIFTPIANFKSALAGPRRVVTFSLPQAMAVITAVVAAGLTLGLTHGVKLG